ncbi:phosphate ABC transporter permease subunit PstC [Vitreimonas flagellata]|uniref:phosphate ABC transporter permease subunit PstC n=1 Tax=Vitreimonas flagellata TaxID=2560861 RepID=UPI001EF8F01D|nr:phosphate ABC transporter permease subunit PstC [Vitreimonas flagellata]
MERDFSKRKVRWGESIIEGLLFLAAVAAVAIVVGIVYVVISESSKFFAQISVIEFLTSTTWTPLFDNPSYGIAPLLTGTFMSTLVALSVAVPLGLLVAIYLSEFANTRTRETIKPTLELLAAVPTVVYGYFALLFVTPLLQRLIPGLPGFNLLSAGMVMGLMIIPYIASLSEDAMRAVPRSMREGSFAMGATRLETAFRVVVPAAISGVVGAIILGMSRAIGETMIVVVAAGTQPQMVVSPTQQGATVTSFIAQVALGDVAFGTLEYNSIFAAGLALLVLTLMFNFVAFYLQRRFREAY